MQPDSESLIIADPFVDARNFRLGVINGLLNNIGETLLDPTLVLVIFLSTLTSSPLILGLVVPIRDGLWSLPQLWVSSFLQSQPHKIILYRRMSVLRIISWGALCLIMNFVQNETILLLAFLLTLLISSFTNGLAGLPFLEVVAKVIPSNRRGEFFAWRLGLGGLCGIGASVIVRWALDPGSHLVYPHNFGLLSFLFFIFSSTSLLIFNQVNEKPDEHILPPVKLPHQLKIAWAAVGSNILYRRYLIMETCLLMAGTATPFFAVYVQQVLGGEKSMVGIYLGVFTGTNLLANIFYGRLSRIRGNSRVIFIASLAGLSMSGVALVISLFAIPFHWSSQLSSLLLIPAFILSALRISGIGVSGNSLLMDIAPDQSRSLYLGFTNTVLGIILLSTGLGGVLMQWLGFQALVTFTIIMHLIALAVALKIDAEIRGATYTHDPKTCD